MKNNTEDTWGADNKVELIGTYGDDLSHALSAWTSTRREIDEDRKNRVDKLLNMLAENGHHTPFEKSSLHFLVTTDVASHIHMLKHRVGTSCVTGDTEIHIPRSKMNGRPTGIKKQTIKELYKRYNEGIFSKSKNGKVYRRQYGRPIPVRSKQLNDDFVERSYIKNVFHNGKHPVYEFKTNSGKSIKSTLDHKFLTPERTWRSIGDYLGVEIIGEKAVFKHKGRFVATNGAQTNVPEKPWTFKNFFETYEGKYTRKEVAELTGHSYELIKKWGYIHDVKFAADNNKDFKKGQTPWNKGKYGYNLNRKKRGINPSNINSNLPWRIWRASVGNWTREQLPKLLKDYKYTCQAQYGTCSRDFVCHHIVPVSVNPSLATEYSNLILVCGDCHKIIHSSYKEECAFAERIKKQDLKTTFRKRKLKKGNKLKVNFEEIVSVRYVGIEDVYDLEVENTHNYVANGFVIHNCNAESARYKELKTDKLFMPQEWPESEKKRYLDHMESAYENYHRALIDLTDHYMEKEGLSKRDARKRAKESARFYLPYGNQITCDLMFNFRSFAHFIGLRYSAHAQREIKNVAEMMLKEVIKCGKFPLTLAAFKFVDDNGNVIPPFE